MNIIFPMWRTPGGVKCQDILDSFCERDRVEGKGRSWQVATRPVTPLRAGISPILPITSLLGMPPVATARTKMGQMSKRPSNHCELQVLGSFRNFAHRQEAVGSFRKSLASALHLQSSVYEISEIGLGKSRKF